MQAIEVWVDSRVYRLSAIKKAAYRLGDRSFVSIEAPAGDQIRVLLTPKNESMRGESLEGDFRNELLDQELREAIAEETERVRNLILAHAFSGLTIEENADTADYQDDPLKIGESQVAKP